MKGIKKVIAAVIIISLCFLTLIGIFTAKKQKLQTLSQSKASKKDLSVTISLTGKINPIDEYTINLSPQQKIAAVYVKEGQKVKIGDPIIKYDTYDLEYQLKKAALSLENLKLNASNTKKQAQINLNSAKSNYENLLTRFSNTEELYKKGAVSKEEYNVAKKALEDSKNQIELAKIQYENSDISSKDSTISKQIEMTQIDIENLKKKISEATVKSKIDGIIVKSNAKANEYPKMGDVVLIYSTSSLKVISQVSQFDAVNLKLNQKAKVKVKGINKEYEGRITKIGQIAETSSAAMTTDSQPKVNVEVTIDKFDSDIKAGYEADVNIIVNEKKNVIAVGYEAVREDNEGRKYVFIVQNKKAVKRYIKTGIETDFEIEILEGLKEGESYIDNPPENLKEGMIVNVEGVKWL